MVAAKRDAWNSRCILNNGLAYSLLNECNTNETYETKIIQFRYLKLLKIKIFFQTNLSPKCMISS